VLNYRNLPFTMSEEVLRANCVLQKSASRSGKKLTVKSNSQPLAGNSSLRRLKLYAKIRIHRFIHL
jgi:hypothetical protein